MKPLKAYYELTPRGIALVIETDGQELPIADDRPSSSRLRKAEPAPEFDELRRWREGAERARKVS